VKIEENKNRVNGFEMGLPLKYSMMPLGKNKINLRIENIADIFDVVSIDDHTTYVSVLEIA
jgi:hypothetical protein